MEGRIGVGGPRDTLGDGSESSNSQGEKRVGPSVYCHPGKSGERDTIQRQEVWGSFGILG